MNRTVQSLLLILALGCGGGGQTTTAVTATPVASVGDNPADDAAQWPRDFVAGPGDGPALFLDETEDAPGIGYVSAGAVLRIGSLPINGRIKVRVAGDLKVRGWLRADRLALYVTQGGRIPETPVSLEPGNFVRYLGPAIAEGMARVEATPALRGGVTAPSFAGIFPVDRLSNTPPLPDLASAPHRDAVRLPAGQEISVYATPDEVALTLPASNPGLVVELARDRGRWKGVRIGMGPRIVGYVDVDVEPVDEFPAAEEPSHAAPGEVPLRLRVDEERPLWRVAAGTRVDYSGSTIGILEIAGWAREMGRFEEDGEVLVDVFIAASDDVALRGTVPAASLSEVQAAP